MHILCNSAACAVITAVFPMEDLLAEARSLADGGVKELILVAQETTLYGVDLYGEKTLPKLLRESGEDPRPWCGSGFSTAIRRRSRMS